jgi:TctA family transporter
METLYSLWQGLANALTLSHLAWSFAGVTLGTAVGVLPGIGPAMTVAILLPVTFSLDPVSAFIMFGGIYYGAMYGGSTTSILINSPGETASIVTAIDGYTMARQGRASAALATAAIGSFVAGTLATLALTFFAPALASMALRFGPAEYFALTILCCSTSWARWAGPCASTTFRWSRRSWASLLGPLAEQQLRRTLAISQGDVSVSVTRPLCLLLLFASVAVLFVPRLLRSQTAGDALPN